MDFNDVFSLRRPRDAKAGLASGAKSIGKGLLAGAWESSRANCTVFVSYRGPSQLAGSTTWLGCCRQLQRVQLQKRLHCGEDLESGTSRQHIGCELRRACTRRHSGSRRCAYRRRSPERRERLCAGMRCRQAFNSCVVNTRDSNSCDLLAQPAKLCRLEAYLLYCSEPVFCSGVAGVVALPVVGIAVGVTQVARGIVNTPEAMAAKANGKHWDQVSC